MKKNAKLGKVYVLVHSHEDQGAMYDVIRVYASEDSATQAADEEWVELATKYDDAGNEFSGSRFDFILNCEELGVYDSWSVNAREVLP